MSEEISTAAGESGITLYGAIIVKPQLGCKHCGDFQAHLERLAAQRSI
jgi:hypothetical protein